MLINKIFFFIFRDSNPVLIKSPPELEGQSLESRLLTYDWANQFESFQATMQKGSFKPLCWSASQSLIQVSIFASINFI